MDIHNTSKGQPKDIQRTPKGIPRDNSYQHRAGTGPTPAGGQDNSRAFNTLNENLFKQILVKENTTMAMVEKGHADHNNGGKGKQRKANVKPATKGSPNKSQ